MLIRTSSLVFSLKFRQPASFPSDKTIGRKTEVFTNQAAFDGKNYNT